tara:strand:+ start:895 stop:1125 length:231 start_codon:yes stop_codon:yes gene_type:complete
MTYEGMLEEIEAADKVKQLEKELDIIKTENEIKDYEIRKLKDKVDMLQKQKKILQNSIRKYGKVKIKNDRSHSRNT